MQRGCGAVEPGQLLNFMRRPLESGGPRMLLHAHRLTFIHPVTRQTMQIESPLPAGFGPAFDAVPGSVRGPA